MTLHTTPSPSPSSSNDVLPLSTRLHECPVLYDVLECYLYNIQLSLPITTTTTSLPLYTDTHDDTLPPSFITPSYYISSSTTTTAITPPSISTTSERLHHVMTRSAASRPALLLSTLFLSRLSLSRASVYRAAVTCLLLASKVHDDDAHHDNSFFAMLSGIPLPHLNILELDVLANLDYRMHVLPHLFERHQHVVLDGALNVASIVSPCLPRRLSALGFGKKDENRPDSPVSTMFHAFDDEEESERIVSCNVEVSKQERQRINLYPVLLCDEQFVL